MVSLILAATVVDESGLVKIPAHLPFVRDTASWVVNWGGSGVGRNVAVSGKSLALQILNVAAGMLTVTSPGKATISLLSISGRLITSIESQGGVMNLNLKSLNLSGGVYVARVKCGDASVSHLVNIN